MRAYAICAAAISALLGLCGCGETEPDLTERVALEEFYFFPDAGADFVVDSTVFDPAIDGTDRLRSTTSWRVTPLDTPGASASAKTYEVTLRDSAGLPRAAQYWQFEQTSAGLTHTYDGLTYLTVAALADLGREWDPLAFGDADLVLPFAGEPVALHKSWSARLDSIGSYALSDGTAVDALYVTLADSENLLELRETREVYGRGLGLLLREQRIFDTQQTGSSAPWEDKAERGFALTMRRRL